MRTNLPVTQREVTYGDNETIVSVTDLKGKILHCNHNFVRISGFTREELLGQPQNIIRHPDMPSEAFRDLWATISVGSPWSGKAW
jgi:aerotaxis receptor